MRVRCPECGNYLKRKSRWQFKSRAFRANMHCTRCGVDYFGRVRFKKFYDHVAVSKSAVAAAKAEPEAKPAES